MNRRYPTHPCTLMAFVLCFALSAAHAQDSTSTRPRDPRPLKDRFWFGGGLGLNFGTATAIQIDPLVGYFIDQKNKLSVGAGLSYWYIRDNRFVPAVEQNGYGYRLFTRYRPVQQFYGHVEFYHLNRELYSYVDRDVKRLWVPHLLLGAGYVQPLAGRSSIYLQVLFDVLQDPNSVYGGQPILSGGVGIGF